MSTDKSNYLHSDITDTILASFYRVYNTMGYGFLEKVYVRAMIIDLRRRGIKVEAEYPVDVWFENYKVGLYYADLLVEDKVVVEVKAAEALCPEHEAQLLNYLRATDLEVGLLLKFGE